MGTKQRCLIAAKIDLDKLEPDFYTTGWGNSHPWSNRFLVSNSMMPILDRSLTMHAMRRTWDSRQSWWARLGPVIRCRMVPTVLPRSCRAGQTCLAPASSLTDDLSAATFSTHNMASTCDFIQPCPRFNPLGNSGPGWVACRRHLCQGHRCSGLGLRPCRRVRPSLL